MCRKYLIVVDDDVDVRNTSEVLFRLRANTDPQRDRLFTKGPSDVLNHATSEITSGSKLGIDATKKLPGEGFNPNSEMGMGSARGPRAGLGGPPKPSCPSSNFPPRTKK